MFTRICAGDLSRSHEHRMSDQALNGLLSKRRGETLARLVSVLTVPFEGFITLFDYVNLLEHHRDFLRMILPENIPTRWPLTSNLSPSNSCDYWSDCAIRVDHADLAVESLSKCDLSSAAALVMPADLVPVLPIANVKQLRPRGDVLNGGRWVNPVALSSGRRLSTPRHFTPRKVTCNIGPPPWSYSTRIQSIDR